MNTIQMYDAQAGSIKLEDIATDSNNRSVLSNVRSNYEGDLNMGTYNGDSDGDYTEDLFIRGEVTDWNEVEYVPEGVKDMGWLGYFVGKNDQLQHLFIRPFEPTTGVSMSDVLESFLKGMSRNRSIQRAIY